MSLAPLLENRCCGCFRLFRLERWTSRHLGGRSFGKPVFVVFVFVCAVFVVVVVAVFRLRLLLRLGPGIP